MDTITMINTEERRVEVMYTQDGRTLLRFVETGTWDVTWYQDMCTGDGWQRMELDTEEYQALNRGHRDYFEANKPEEIVYGFCYEDVQDLREDLDREEAMEVLARCAHMFDASIGLHWDIIEAHAEYLYPKPGI